MIAPEGRRLSRLTGTRLRRLVLAVCTICIIAVHAPVLGYKCFANVDEAYAGALGERILEGFKLYQGAISQRGPLMYYTYAFIAKTVGWDNIVGLRVYALLFALAQLWLVHWTARRLFSDRAAIFATLVIAYVLTVGLPQYDRLALNGEYLQTPWLLAGSTLGAIAFARTGLGRGATTRRLLLLVASGLLIGAGVSIKQSAALHVLPVCAGIVIQGLRLRRSRGAIVRDLVVFGAAFSALPLAFILHAWADGTLDAMLYYTARYNVFVHIRGQSNWKVPLAFEFKGNTGFVLALAAIIVHTIIATRVRPVRLGRLLRRFSLAHYVNLQLIIAVISASALQRFFPHYFVVAMPFLAVSLGYIGHDLTRRIPARSTKIWSLCATLMIFLFSFAETYALERIDGLVTHEHIVKRISKYIELTTQPDDKIFVWGFSPWLYGYSHRRPAGRYVFSTYVTGVVPWSHDEIEVEAKRIVPGSVEALLGDLESEKPELVIDAGSVLLSRPMTSFEKPAAYLHEHYCFEVRIRAHDIYRRKPATGCVDARFPEPARAIDYSGRAIDVPVPKSVGGPNMAWLPMLDERSPVWFVEPPYAAALDYLLDPIDGKKGMRLDPATTPILPGHIPVKN